MQNQSDVQNEGEKILEGLNVLQWFLLSHVCYSTWAQFLILIIGSVSAE